MLSSSVLLLALLPTLVGCHRVSDARSDTSGPSCPEGQVDDGGTCVPEACGTGRWGNAPTDPDTVYVLEGGAGDGTEGAPLGSLAEAIVLAATRASKTVAVGAGRYIEDLQLDETVDGVRVTGRCREQVVVDGSDIPRRNPRPLLYINGVGRGDRRTPELSLEEITFQDAPGMGIIADDALLTLRRVDVVRAGALAVGIVQSEATFEDVRIIETLAGEAGRALEVGEGAVVHAMRLEVQGATERGVYASGSGTLVTLEDSRVVGVGEQDGEWRAVGVTARAGATIDAVRLKVEATVGTAVLADGQGTSVRLVDAHLRDTQTPENTADGVYDVGLLAQNGADVQADTSLVEGTTGFGVLVIGDGATVVGRGLEVRDGLQFRGNSGSGVGVSEGGRFGCTGCRVLDNTEHGILVRDAGSAVDLDDVEVRGTRATRSGDFGRGIGVFLDATLVGTDVVIADNHGVGLVAGSRTVVRLTRSDVGWTRYTRSAARADGVVAQEGARLTLTDTSVHDNEGVGVLSLVRAVTTVRNSVVSRNHFAGIGVNGGFLDIEDSRIEDTLASPTAGGGMGIYVEADYPSQGVQALRNYVGPHPLAAIWLLGNGDYSIRGNEIHGGLGTEQGGQRIHGNGVYAGNGVRVRGAEGGLTLAENTFVGDTDVMILLDASGARIGVNWWESTSARAQVWAQRCDGSSEVAAPDDLDIVACDGGTLLTRNDMLPSTSFTEPSVDVTTP